MESPSPTGAATVGMRQSGRGVKMSFRKREAASGLQHLATLTEDREPAATRRGLLDSEEAGGWREGPSHQAFG